MLDGLQLLITAVGGMLTGSEGSFRELADAILLAQGLEHVFGSTKGFSTVMAGIAQ